MQEVVLPALGQSVEEASIVAWLKNEGDAVKEGEPICTIQTDKAEIECESTAGGVLRKILVEPDVFVPVLTPIALVGTADEALPESVSTPAAPSAPAAKDSAPAAPAPEPAATAKPSQSASATPARIDAPVSPRARAAAKEMHVDPAIVAGSGVGGRVMEADVQAHAKGAPKASSTAKRLAEQKGIDLRLIEGSGTGGRITKEDVLAQAGQAKAAPSAAPAASPGMGTVTPLSPMRKIIAQRMSESKFTAPHYYVSIEVDMQQAIAFRNAQTEFKPSFNDLVLRAVVRAIQKVPAVNARWLGDAIEIMDEINLGVAVALPAGLVVPVIRQAQVKSLQDISRESRALADKAKNNKLLPDDYQGNTFTVSNMGVYGIDHFTAIINQPDSAILAIGAIKDQVVAINGGICIRPRMMMTISSDHRVIDGAVAAQFMAALKDTLEAADF